MDTQVTILQWVTTLDSDMDRVIDANLQNIWGDWVPDFGQTWGHRNDHLRALRVYRQFHHLFGPIIKAQDRHILDLQRDHIETNRRITYL